MVDQENFIGFYYLDNQTCNQLIDLHKTSNRKYKGKIADTEKKELDTDMKDSIDVNFRGEELIQEPVIKKYLNHLKNSINKYMEKYPEAGTLKLKIVELNIQHYEPGGGFKIFHCENSTKDTINRHLVFMTYLNDVNDGGTIFKYQNLITPATKGSTLIWPVNWTHTHKGQISNTSEKYIITGWLERE